MEGAGGDSFDFGDFLGDQSFFAFARGAGNHTDAVATAEIVLADEVGWNENFILLGAEVGGGKPEHAALVAAFVGHFNTAFRLKFRAAAGKIHEQIINQLVFGARVHPQVQIFTHLVKLGKWLCLEGIDV